MKFILNLKYHLKKKIKKIKKYYFIYLIIKY
jgi:hypothetical protein